MRLDPQTLSHVKLFAGLTELTLGDLAAVALVRHYRRGMLLFSAGEPSEAVFFVLRGTVRVYRDTPEGHEQTLQVMRDGDSINVVGFLDECTYPASAETVADSDLAAIRCADFSRLTKARSDLAWALVTEIGHRLRWAQSRIYDFALRTASGRVASSLLYLAQHDGKPQNDGSYLLNMPMTHRELGQLAGLSRETVTRMLPRLRAEGAIHWTEEGHVVVDPQRLKDWLADQNES